MHRQTTALTTRERQFASCRVTVRRKSGQPAGLEAVGCAVGRVVAPVERVELWAGAAGAAGRDRGVEEKERRRSAPRLAQSECSAAGVKKIDRHRPGLQFISSLARKLSS